MGRKKQNTQETAPISAEIAPVQAEIPAVTQPEVAPVAAPKEETVKKYVDEHTYNKFCNLKFSSLSGALLNETQKKELTRIEAEVMVCAGKLPVKTVTAAVKNERLRMVKDTPMPERFHDIINSAGDFAKKYYLG